MIKIIVVVMSIFNNISWLFFFVLMLFVTLLMIWFLMLYLVLFLLLLKSLGVGHWDTVFVASVFRSIAMYQFLMSIIIVTWMLRVPSTLVDELTSME